MHFLTRLEEPTYVAMRAVVGALFVFHGLQKLFVRFTDKALPPVFSQLWFGGAIELVCGTLIAIGLGTRFVFLFIACRGPGKLALDNRVG